MRPRQRARATRFIVRATVTAEAEIASTRGKDRASVDATVSELAAQGCRQAGVRLLARDGTWSRFCARRGNGPQRIITTFITPDDMEDEFASLGDDERLVAVILHVGSHDDEAFYRKLADSYDIAAIGQNRAEKPRCCGPSGWPTLGELPARKKRPRGRGKT